MAAKITVYHGQIIEGTEKINNEVFKTSITNIPVAGDVPPLNSDTALAVTNWAKNNYLPITDDIYQQTKYEEEVLLVGDILATL